MNTAAFNSAPALRKRAEGQAAASTAPDSHSVHKGSLILVNRQYPYFGDGPESFLTAVGSWGSGQTPVLMERRSAGILKLLLKKLDAGGRIVPVSGWRSRREQTEIYQGSVMENGQAFTSKYVALPGHSEHQTGLAIDLAENRPDIDFICPEFPYEGICQEFRRQAPHYGFIERYPKDKEAVTEIGWEPWHFRYVGFPHALIMSQRNLSLEEYHAFLKEYPYGERALCFEAAEHAVEVSYVAAEAGGKAPALGLPAPYLLSGNNMDGFVVTVWRRTRR